jgi:hypothetical protein
VPQPPSNLGAPLLSIPKNLYSRPISGSASPSIFCIFVLSALMDHGLGG